jgi:hypothetical protein
MRFLVECDPVIISMLLKLTASTSLHILTQQLKEEQISLGYGAEPREIAIRAKAEKQFLCLGL